MGRSYKVLYQTGLSIRKHGISSEFSFPVDYRKLVDLIEGACNHLEDCRTNHKLYQTFHISVRFVPQSKAYLSPCCDGPRMFIDFPTLEDVKGREQIMKMTQDQLTTLGGVPHWGKVNDSIYNKHEFIDIHYPKAKRWREIRRSLDPKGTFLSDFIKKVGLE